MLSLPNELTYASYVLYQHSIGTGTYQRILVVLPRHEDDPLGVHQLGVVDQAQALRGILPVGL